MGTVYTALELAKGGHAFCTSTNWGLDQGVVTSTLPPMWSSPDVEHHPDHLQCEASPERGCHLHSLGACLWWACRLLLANMERTNSWAPSTPPVTMLEASSSTSSIMRNAATSTCRHHLHRLRTRRGRRLHQHVPSDYIDTASQSSSTLHLATVSSTSMPTDVHVTLPSSLTYCLARTNIAPARRHSSTPTIYTERRSSP